MAGNDAESHLDLRLPDERKQACFGHMGSFHGHVGAWSTHDAQGLTERGRDRFDVVARA